MQPYEPSRPRPQPVHSQIPGMRPARETADRASRERSNTPIYDALYAEYRRLFRTLPGDRSGEESLRFEGFGTLYSTGLSGSWHEDRRLRGHSRPAALPPGRGDAREHGL
nr:hypothetical protein [Streptomyces tardus]